MKKFLFYTILALGGMNLCSCGSSKKVEKSPIKTFLMPCSELVSGDGVLRAWASGKSDNEMAARKKAQVAASAELAAMLGRTVKATTENYTASLSESGTGASKSLLVEKTNVAVNQSLKGAAIVCDRWVKDETSGQYSNYLVMELRGEEYLNILYEELSKNSNVSVDKELLKELFFKYIDENIK